MSYLIKPLKLILLLCGSVIYLSGLLFARNAQICECKEYWSCVLGGGDPKSFCGLQDTKVCCFPKQRWNSECGIKGADLSKNTDPVGVASPGEWPWHVALLDKNAVYVCGASLIDEYWLLTAAHCVEKFKSNDVSVRLGEHDVTNIQEPILHEERQVSKILIHPEFDNKTLKNDIAMLKLEFPADKRPNVDIVCIPEYNITFNAKSMCYITGWGRRSEETKHSVVLKEVAVPLWNNSNCQSALQKIFGPKFILSELSICAGAEGRDACDGDGGGPLVCNLDGRWYQVGIVSFGIGCGRRNVPGVYTRVQPYQMWILDTVLKYRPKNTIFKSYLDSATTS